jgi:hypothetical protein
MLGFGVVVADSLPPLEHNAAGSQYKDSFRSFKLSNFPCKGKLYSHNQPIAKTVKAREYIQVPD